MKIAVYCGASAGNEDIYAEKAAELGRWIAENGNTLVYGGGKYGLMGIVARSVLEAGGKVIGVIPTFLKERELSLETVTELIETDNMSTRKNKMFEQAEAFIAMPGGPGTLEEISEVVSWSHIGQNDKPCIFYNVNNYYNSLIEFFINMQNEGFTDKSTLEKLLFSDDLEKIGKFIEDYQPPELRDYK